MKRSNMPTIYKVMPRQMWQAATDAGEFAGSPVDVADGFIHFSSAAQLGETIAKHFAGQSDLVLLAVDADCLGEKLKWEPSRGGALFPHLYCAMPIDAVGNEYDLPMNEDGQHIVPDWI